MNNTFLFDSLLVEGLILKRPNRFIMAVEVDGQVADCHCPTTGRIGNIVMENIPCLLSKSKDATRKTPYTVEAISFDLPSKADKSWIGINQNAVNRYVEFYLRNGDFSEMVGNGHDILREKFLGNSKLDFLVGDTYLEVKTPLQQIQVDIPSHIKAKKKAPFSSTDRMVRHITELAGSLQEHQRAILLTCFVYKNPGFQIIEKSTNYEQVRYVVDNSATAGVEMWQANFEISPKAVRLIRYTRLDLSQG